jgi:hypothetical protein
MFWYKSSLPAEAAEPLLLSSGWNILLSLADIVEETRLSLKDFGLAVQSLSGARMLHWQRL